MTFFKTGSVGALGGAIIGSAAGLGLQSARLRGKPMSTRERRLLLDIAKQKLEVREDPSPGNTRKLKMLQLQNQVASMFKQRPGLALMASGMTGAVVGGITGRRIGQL